MARRRRDDDDEDGDTPAAPQKPKPRSDAYVGMLGITTAALIAAGVLFYMDFEALNAQQVSPPQVAVPALGASSTAP